MLALYAFMDISYLEVDALLALRDLNLVLKEYVCYAISATARDAI